MQFNYIVSTNTAAVKLWKELHFAIIGTIPGAFRNHQHGFLDVLIRFRTLQ